jgi:hypothetical protein
MHHIAQLVDEEGLAAAMVGEIELSTKPGGYKADEYIHGLAQLGARKVIAGPTSPHWPASTATHSAGTHPGCALVILGYPHAGPWPVSPTSQSIALMTSARATVRLEQLHGG